MTAVVLSAPPPGWVTARGRISGLLLALREAELEGDDALPPPVAGGAALRAWAAAEHGAGAPDARAALDLLGRTARLLGACLCVAGSTGLRDVITTVLRDEAVVHGCAPERLVAELARAHGVLTASSPGSAASIWHALDDPDLR